MTETAEVLRAGIYCRISRADIDDKTKTADQERICRGMCDRYGWEVVDVYTDDNQSAWKHNRKRRQWDRMLADVKAGRINAIVVYHGDRLVRQPRDLEDLIDLARGKGIKLASPTGTRDLGSDEDQFILTIEAAMARRESANTSRRKKAEYDRLRRKGLVRPGGGGGRAFGFGSGGVIHVPAETAVIRDAAAAVLSGMSVGKIAADFRDRGVCSTAGKPISHSTLRRILVSPRTAGLMPDGIHEAAWEPVLDMATWEMVRGVLEANRANPRAGAGALHLLSGIATCGECSHVLYAARNAAGPAYRCPLPQCGRVVRGMMLLDAYVSGAVVARLSREDNPQPEVQLHDGAAAELASLSARRDETEAFIASLADAPLRRIEVLSRALDSFDKKIEAVRRQMAGDSSARLRASYAGITRKEFAALPLDVRRSLVKGTYRVIVLRSSQRGPGFRPEDVVLAPV